MTHGRVAGVFLATIAGFVALLVVAEAVPDEAVVDRLVDAIQAGDYGPPGQDDGMGGFHDGFTECVALGQGLGSPPEPMGLVPRALWAPRIGSCEDGADQVLALDAGEQVPAGPYYRYWSGYAPLVRPVVAIGGVGGLRLVVSLLLAAATVALAVAVGRRLGWWATAGLLVPVAVASNLVFTPANGFTHALSMTAAAVGVAAVAVATDRRAWWAPAAAAAGGAALFVYVDLLTTPAIPWALSVFVAGAIRLRRDQADVPGAARTMAAVAIAWPVAYAATWASRWVVAASVHGREVLDTVTEISRFRVSGDAAGVQDTLGAATRTNLRWWLDHASPARAVLVLVLVMLAAGLVVVLRRAARPGAGALHVAVLASPALLVPAWYEVLSNHSQIHAFFTYRGVPVAVGIVVASVVVAATAPVSPAETGPPEDGG